MIFLIEYDRQCGRLMSLASFEDSQAGEAADSRLDLELRLHREGIEREIVLLDAENEEAIRLTHGRYFYDLDEIIRAFEASGM